MARLKVVKSDGTNGNGPRDQEVISCEIFVFQRWRCRPSPLAPG